MRNKTILLAGLLAGALPFFEWSAGWHFPVDDAEITASGKNPGPNLVQPLKSPIAVKHYAQTLWQYDGASRPYPEKGKAHG